MLIHNISPMRSSPQKLRCVFRRIFSPLIISYFFVLSNSVSDPQRGFSKGIPRIAGKSLRDAVSSARQASNGTASPRNLAESRKHSGISYRFRKKKILFLKISIAYR